VTSPRYGNARKAKLERKCSISQCLEGDNLKARYRLEVARRLSVSTSKPRSTEVALLCQPVGLFPVVRPTMPHIRAAHPEDHILGNIGCMVGDALQVTRDEQNIQRLARA